MGNYASVDKRLEKWGLGDFDRLVYSTTVSTETAKIYVAAIMGPTFPLQFRFIPARHADSQRLLAQVEPDLLLATLAHPPRVRPRVDGRRTAIIA